MRSFLGVQAQAAFTRHMNQLKHHGVVTCVNLIDKKKDQLMLGEAFERAVNRLNSDQVKCVWSDWIDSIGVVWVMQSFDTRNRVSPGLCGLTSTMSAAKCAGETCPSLWTSLKRPCVTLGKTQ